MIAFLGRIMIRMKGREGRERQEEGEKEGKNRCKMENNCKKRENKEKEKKTPIFIYIKCHEESGRQKSGNTRESVMNQKRKKKKYLIFFRITE